MYVVERLVQPSGGSVDYDGWNPNTRRVTPTARVSWMEAVLNVELPLTTIQPQFVLTLCSLTRLTHLLAFAY